MRTLRFRAWMKASKVMEYDPFVHVTHQDDIHLNAILGRTDLQYVFMQFTGLHDKNGKEIYEGDVVKYYLLDTKPVDLDVVSVVFFEEGQFSVGKLNGEPLSLREAVKISNKTGKSIEIIGNIYENPDLLTDKT